ncbi:hypothetical protein QTO04_29325, partial [Vibrio parahaemolyticus]
NGSCREKSRNHEYHPKSKEITTKDINTVVPHVFSQLIYHCLPYIYNVAAKAEKKALSRITTISNGAARINIQTAGSAKCSNCSPAYFIDINNPNAA